MTAKQNQTLSEGLLAIAGILLIVAILVVLLCSGCATATATYDTQGNIIGGQSSGFLRDIEVTQRKADGSTVTIKGTSTSASLLKSGNELLGTVVNAAAKATP